MHLGHDVVERAVARRAFLVASGVGFCGLDLAALNAAAAPSQPARAKRAKSTILIWLCGGSSHIDMWDLKPDAPEEYRGEFQPIATSAPGIRICEHMPRIAKQAHHLTIVNSLGHYGRGTGDHHAGYYYNLTGHEPDQSFRALLNARVPYASDWPFMGSVVTSKRPAHPYLPSLITLPQKPGAPSFTRPGQFSARLGLEHEPVYVQGDLDRPIDFAIPALTLSGDVSIERLQSRRMLLDGLDAAMRSADQQEPLINYSGHQSKAFSLLGSRRSKSALDLSKEPLAVRERYGNTVNGTSMLLARRLVEAEVPFVSVFWMENPKLAKLCKSAGGWDTHGNNFNCLRDHLLPEFDRSFAALIEDLSERGLLDETLVMVNSEMGRMPKVGDRRSGGTKGAGRDHWTSCMSVVFAGGGMRGGQVYGSSDKIAAYPLHKPVAPEDITKTVYHAMGIEDLQATDRQGRPFDLLPEGAVIKELF